MAEWQLVLFLKLGKLGQTRLNNILTLYEMSLFYACHEGIQTSIYIFSYNLNIRSTPVSGQIRIGKMSNSKIC